MKKVIGLFLVSLLVLTGCGKEDTPKDESKENLTKTLTCKMEEELEGMSIKEEGMYIFDLSTGELLNYNANYTIIIDSELDDYYNDLLLEAEEALPSEKTEGLELSVSGNGKDTVIMSEKVDYKKLSDEDKEDYLPNLDEVNYETVKENMVGNGYTCE